MPKQFGQIKLKGKVGDDSYYYSRLGGFQTRKLNPNMSERVKTDERFANTRKNAKEFGGAASTAGAIVKGISERWRYIRIPNAPSRLTKIIQAATMQDNSMPWGRRSLPLSEMPNVQEAYNRMSKNQCPQFIRQYISEQVTYDAYRMEIDFNQALYTTAEFERDLIAKGADGFEQYIYVYRVRKSYFNPQMMDFYPAEYELTETSDVGQAIAIDGEGGHLMRSAITPRTQAEPINTYASLGGLLCVYLPYKNSASGRVILQNLCFAYWKSLNLSPANTVTLEMTLTPHDSGYVTSPTEVAEGSSYTITFVSSTAVSDYALFRVYDEWEGWQTLTIAETITQIALRNRYKYDIRLWGTPLENGDNVVILGTGDNDGLITGRRQYEQGEWVALHYNGDVPTGYHVEWYSYDHTNARTKLTDGPTLRYYMDQTVLYLKVEVVRTV